MNKEEWLASLRVEWAKIEGRFAGHTAPLPPFPEGPFPNYFWLWFQELQPSIAVHLVIMVVMQAEMVSEIDGLVQVLEDEAQLDS